MRNLKLYYSASSYLSHARVAGNYLDFIRARYQVTDSVTDADIVILHQEPHDYGAIYRACPELSQKYVIGCCVWEANDLPDNYKQSLQYVQEVWTCSQYCYDVFKKYHPAVTRVPYAIDRDLGCGEADRHFVRKAVSYEQQYIYFLTVTKLRDKRKNLRTLVQAFHRCVRAMPKARLIVKTGPGLPATGPSDGRIIYLSQRLTDAQLNALYELADSYVSVHHAEGWGLTLSDAMIFRKPVAATGYSGNLEFMNGRNSLLIGFSEENIRPEDCFANFHSGMKWAYPNEEDIERKLLFLYDNCRGGPLPMVEQAAEDIKLFAPPAVAHIVHERLDQVLSSRL